MPYETFRETKTVDSRDAARQDAHAHASAEEKDRVTQAPRGTRLWFYENPQTAVMPHVHELVNATYPRYYPPGHPLRDDAHYVYVNPMRQPVPDGAEPDRETHGRIYANPDQMMAKSDAVPGWTNLCRDCRRPIRWNEVVAGPTRSPRDGTFKPVQYWHESCEKPFGAIAPYTRFPIPVRDYGSERDPFANGRGAASDKAERTSADTGNSQSQSDSQTESAASDASQSAAENADSRDAGNSQAADTSNDQAQLDALTALITGIQDRMRAEFQAELAKERAERQRLQDELDALAAKSNTAAQTQAQTYWLGSTVDARKLSAGLRHKSYDLLWRAALGTTRATYRQWWLKGPAGTGKTTAAAQLANDLAIYHGLTLGDDFHFVAVGTVASQYELQGFRDGHGDLHLHEMFKAWTCGGVVIYDEFAGNPRDVILWLNGGLSADGWLQFAHGMYKRHPLCYVIAADNTWGYGGDALYDRSPVDQSSLNRFQDVDWPSDERLEHAMTATDQIVVDWVDAVQATRALINAGEAQVLISPRQMVIGEMQIQSALLTAAEIVHVACADLMSTETWPTFGRPMIEWQTRYAAEIDRRIAARERRAHAAYVENLICSQIAGVN